VNRLSTGYQQSLRDRTIAISRQVSQNGRLKIQEKILAKARLTCIRKGLAGAAVQETTQPISRIDIDLIDEMDSHDDPGRPPVRVRSGPVRL